MASFLPKIFEGTAVRHKPVPLVLCVIYTTYAVHPTFLAVDAVPMSKSIRILRQIRITFTCHYIAVG